MPRNNRSVVEARRFFRAHHTIPTIVESRPQKRSKGSGHWSYTDIIFNISNVPLTEIRWVVRYIDEAYMLRHKRTITFTTDEGPKLDWVECICSGSADTKFPQSVPVGAVTFTQFPVHLTEELIRLFKERGVTLIK